MTPRFFHGQFVIHWLGLPMTNVHAKFEVFTFADYEDSKDNAKCRNWGGWGWLGVIQSHRQHNHSIEHIQLSNRLIDTMHLPHTVFELYIASYWSKVTNFNLLRLHLVPPLGVAPFELCRDLWHQKLESPDRRMALFAWSCI